MKKRVLRIIGVVFKPATFKKLKLWSKLSRTILTIKSKIEKALRKLGNKQENYLQQETEEVSRRIGEPTVDPRPTQPPNPIRVRRIGEPTVNRQPKQPPNPIRLRKIGETTITSRTTFVGLRKIGVATVNPRPKKTPRPVR